jgi:transcriptional regulator with XRE-family HTH domain
MATRFDRYYEKQMENANLRAAVEKELASLDVGIQIALAREAKHMNQTQLAAKAGMNASKISRIENLAQNLTLNTLNRIAEALDCKVNIELVPKQRKRARAAVAVAHKRAR